MHVCINSTISVMYSLRVASVVSCSPLQHSTLTDKCQVSSLWQIYVCRLWYRTNLCPGICHLSVPAGDGWCWGHCRPARSHAHMHRSLHSTASLEHSSPQISTRSAGLYQQKYILLFTALTCNSCLEYSGRQPHHRCKCTPSRLRSWCMLHP